MHRCFLLTLQSYGDFFIYELFSTHFLQKNALLLMYINDCVRTHTVFDVFLWFFVCLDVFGILTVSRNEFHTEITERTERFSVISFI